MTHKHQADGGLPGVLSLMDMVKQQKLNWLIGGLIQERSLSILFGPSNTFKSFLALDMSLSVATGREFHNCAVQQRNVLMISTEGSRATGNSRVPAWFERHGEDLKKHEDRIFMYPHEVHFDVPGNVDRIIEQCSANQIGLVCADIFGGLIAGSEIDDKSVGVWVNSARRIIDEAGVSILIVAHTPHERSDRARMHSHLWGSFDTRLQVKRPAKNQLRCSRPSQGQEPDFDFHLARTEQQRQTAFCYANCG